MKTNNTVVDLTDLWPSASQKNIHFNAFLLEHESSVSTQVHQDLVDALGRPAAYENGYAVEASTRVITSQENVERVLDRL